MAWKQSTNMVAPLLFPVTHTQTQTLLPSILKSPDCYVCTSWPSVTSLPKQTLSSVPHLHLSGTAPLNPSLFSPDTHFNLPFFSSLPSTHPALPDSLFFGERFWLRAEVRIIDSSVHCMILFIIEYWCRKSSKWIFFPSIATKPQYCGGTASVALL